MHSLTTEILQPSTYAYAAIPTYYDPSRFLLCKVYIEDVWHGMQAIFYHCTIAELLNTDAVALQTIKTCQVRCIERSNGKVALRNIATKQFSMTNTAMLQDIQCWHKDFVLDIPAPFICSTEPKLMQMHKQLQSYFEQLALNAKKL